MVDPGQQDPVQTAQPPDYPNGLFSREAASVKARRKQQREFNTRWPETPPSGCAFMPTEASVPD